MRRPPPRGARRTWPPLRRLVTRLGVLGGLALILWAVENRTGWEALDADARAEAAARFSEEASRIATKPATTSAPSNTQTAPAAVGGDLAYPTPKRCLDLYQLAFERKLKAEPDRARSPFSPTRHGTFAASAARARPSATHCKRASSWDRGSDSRTTPRASSCDSNSRKTRSIGAQTPSTSSPRTAETAAASTSIPRERTPRRP